MRQLAFQKLCNNNYNYSNNSETYGRERGREGKREREKNDIVIYIMLNLYISSTSQTPREENKVTDIVWGGGNGTLVE